MVTEPEQTEKAFAVRNVTILGLGRHTLIGKRNTWRSILGNRGLGNASIGRLETGKYPVLAARYAVQKQRPTTAITESHSS